MLFVMVAAACRYAGAARQHQRPREEIGRKGGRREPRMIGN